MYFNENILKNIGLTEAESVIYLTLLKYNSSTVKELSTKCKYQRPNIYDILEQLQLKGLVSMHFEKNTQIFQAGDPNLLLNFIKEKEDFLNSIMDNLHKLQKNNINETKVEVYKGENGMKFLFRDIIKNSTKLYAINVRGQLREHVSQNFIDYILREFERKKIEYYPIYTTRKFDPPYCTEIRYLPESYASPVVTFIYGNKVCINIWEPTLIAIIIDSPDVAKTYKNHFDIIWKLAKK